MFGLKIRTTYTNVTQLFVKCTLLLFIAFLIIFLVMTLTSCSTSSQSNTIVTLLDSKMPDNSKSILTANINKPNVDLRELNPYAEQGITLSEFYFDDCLLMLLLEMDSDIATDQIEIVCNGETLPPEIKKGRTSENNELYLLLGSPGDYRETEKIELSFYYGDHYVDISSLLLNGKTSGLKINYLINESVTIGEFTFELESYEYAD